MHSWPLLTLLIATPILGALLILLMRDQTPEDQRNIKYAGLWFSFIAFILSLLAFSRFDASSAEFQLVEYVPWLENYQIGYHLGVDGLSIFLILLTTFLTPLCLLASWASVKQRIRAYVAAFLILEAFVIGVFCALDFLLFYILFEGMLIPMYLIIGIWGGDRRVYAAFKFFLYTLLGSVLLLIALLYIFVQSGTTSMPLLMTLVPQYALEVQKWLWLAFFASFAVKVPMWPFHTWLPDAHVQAPTAGSVILAGILLKMGGYGFLRFSLPMLPEASHAFAPMMYGLSIVAIIYTSLVALVQDDMKKLIAYSSIAHMGMVTIGLFTFTPEGISGAMMQMISHGLVSGALFMCVGVLYDRIHSREIARYGGLVHRMPFFAFAFLLFTMASVGLPGTSGFVGEILVLAGAWQSNPWVAAGAATGMILGAAYSLWLYRRVVLGELVKSDLKKITDTNGREILSFIPIIILVIWLGVQPTPLLKAMEPSIQKLIHQSCQVENPTGGCAHSQATSASTTDPMGKVAAPEGEEGKVETPATEAIEQPVEADPKPSDTTAPSSDANEAKPEPASENQPKAESTKSEETKAENNPEPETNLMDEGQ